MRLTRRGYGVVAVVLLTESFAFTYGQQALNAVAAPAIVALLAGVVQVYRTEVPVADREAVPAGFPGDTREVTVDVDGSGIARVSDEIPPGLAAERPETEGALPRTLTYTLTCGKRGRHDLGPTTAWVRDVLGLVERRHEAGGTDEVVVFPPVYKVAGQELLVETVLERSEVERQEFDTLREYAPGDPLRDVHWKTTAKDPDEIYVTEFADRQVDRDVVIAASATPDGADEMAIAAASLAVVAIDADLGTELRIPEGTIPVGYGRSQREQILTALAGTDGGDLTPDQLADDVDVRIDADADGVTVTFGEQSRSLADMTVSRENPLVARGAGS